LEGNIEFRIKLERLLLRLRRIFLVLGGIFGLVGALLLGASVFSHDKASTLTEANAEDNSDCGPGSACGPIRYAVDESPVVTATVPIVARLDPAPSPGLPAASPEIVQTPDPVTPGPTPTAPRRMLVPPTPGVPTATALPTVNAGTDLIAADSYTSTAQVHARVDTPAAYQLVPEFLGLVKFDGPTAPDPPQLSGLFLPNRGPLVSTTYRINDWLWDAGQCGGQVDGCPGSLIDDWEVTLVGLATRPGESLSIPERAANIYPGGYIALVLYAADSQITLGYTRRDTVSDGYAVHVQGLCVDPNLVALYRAQNDANGRRASGLLPALRADQVIGLALGDEIKVAIRDKGTFMDPRSGKDWWRGY
jgi:hypothetical protein